MDSLDERRLSEAESKISELIRQLASVSVILTQHEADLKEIRVKLGVHKHE
jgi:uncharacterized coiled-coil protein SlyX